MWECRDRAWQDVSMSVIRMQRNQKSLLLPSQHRFVNETLCTNALATTCTFRSMDKLWGLDIGSPKPINPNPKTLNLGFWVGCWGQCWSNFDCHVVACFDGLFG